MSTDTQDVVELTRKLIRIPSASQVSNVEITDFVESLLAPTEFRTERISYVDEEGIEKACLVAKAGSGTGGLGFFAHSDTVPGMEDHWQPYDPVMENGRLIGRGACDMKGPLAATLVALARLPLEKLNAPLYLIVSADEEVHYKGAYATIANSEILGEAWPTNGVVTEPTRLIPVHAHKGGIRISVTALGKAAHTSTGKGKSANFKIAPFLAEMAKLAELFDLDNRFQNDEFDPPTNGFNMVLDDGDCALNVTAAKTVCTLSIRPMPNDHHEEALDLIRQAAVKNDLEIEVKEFPFVYVDPQSAVVQAAIESTGADRSETVPYGTEAAVYKEFCDLVVLGPGDIAQAHTIGEWIDIEQLRRSVEVYERIIRRICMS